MFRFFGVCCHLLCCFFFCLHFFLCLKKRILRYQTISKNFCILCSPFIFLYHICGVSLNHLQGSGFLHFFYNADMIRASILIQIKENQISAFGLFCLASHIHSSIFQFRNPCCTAGVDRHLFCRNSCIPDAKCRKHGAPVSILISIPRTVACISLPRYSVICKPEIFPAFLISHLTLCNQNYIFRPVFRQILWNCTFPVRFRFYIRRLINQAFYCMRMFRCRTHKFCLVAFFCVMMCRNRFLFFFPTDLFPFCIITVFGMCMPFLPIAFLFLTNQCFGIAGIRMNMFCRVTTLIICRHGNTGMVQFPADNQENPGSQGKKHRQISSDAFMSVLKTADIMI